MHINTTNKRALEQQLMWNDTHLEAFHPSTYPSVKTMSETETFLQPKQPKSILLMKDLKSSWLINVLKSSLAISRVNVEFKIKVSEISCLHHQGRR
jgi:hypothetical protein